MGFEKIKCNACGHEFTFDAERDFVFCVQCGSKIMLRSAAQPAPVAQPIPVPQPAPVPQSAPIQQPSPIPQPFDPVINMPVEIRADLSLAIDCYNKRNYNAANECLALLEESEPDNSGVWFCRCKVLAAEKPTDIAKAAEEFVNAASKCLSLGGNQPELREKLTLEFNTFLKNMTDAITADNLYLAPYDKSIMSENVPSVSYQPLSYVDSYYFLLINCIQSFQQKVNPNYLNVYFLQIWDKSFYCFAHVISQKMCDNMGKSKMFYWYKMELNNRTTSDAALRALADFIYGYKAAFFNMLSRVPYKDVRALIINKIIFLDKWLLKMKHLAPNGTYIFLVYDTRQRDALEQEIHNLKISLSK